MWWIYALLAALFAALTAVFAKIGIAGVNSNLATAIRTVVVLILVWVIVLSRGEQKGMALLSKQNLLFIALSGLATGLSWLFYFKALQLGKVSQIAPVDKLSVVFAIILALVFLRESIDIKTAAGAALIVLGAIVLAW